MLEDLSIGKIILLLAGLAFLFVFVSAISVAVRKKSSPLSRIVGLLIALSAVVIALNWQSVYRAFAPPNPVIVDKGGDDLSSKLFDHSLRVWADVRNDGGDGTVAMEATISQGDKTYTQTTTGYFRSLRTARMQIVFEEPTFLGTLFKGGWKYSVRVFAYGK